MTELVTTIRCILYKPSGWVSFIISVTPTGGSDKHGSIRIKSDTLSEIQKKKKKKCVYPRTRTHRNIEHSHSQFRDIFYRLLFAVTPPRSWGPGATGTSFLRVDVLLCSDSLHSSKHLIVISQKDILPVNELRHATYFDFFCFVYKTSLLKPTPLLLALKVTNSNVIHLLRDLFWFRQEDAFFFFFLLPTFCFYSISLSLSVSELACELSFGWSCKSLKTLSGEGRVRPEMTIWELPGLPSGSLLCSVSHPWCH